MVDYYNIFESAFERFSIMTVDGKVPDKEALEAIEERYGEKIRIVVERKIKENGNL